MKRQVKKASLAERVIALVEEARKKVAGVANVALVYTYYETGWMIVEEEQGGKKRAEYGKELLKDLSRKLTDRFGKGWSVENLTLMRKFFLSYSSTEISATPLRKLTEGNYETPSRKSSEQEIVNSVYEIQGRGNSANAVCPIPRFVLFWSHYLVLMRISDPAERAFYEKEAAEGHWSLTLLSRQIGSWLVWTIISANWSSPRGDTPCDLWVRRAGTHPYESERWMQR